MDFGTALTDKRELVLAAITAVVHLTARGGNRVGALVSNGEQTYRIPALPGTAHARYLIRRIAATPKAQSSGADNLVAMLESLRRPPRRRGLVAVVSDFLDTSGAQPPAWQRALKALSGRHELLGIEVLDPRELVLTNAGLVTFVDPETGRQLEVQTLTELCRSATPPRPPPSGASSPRRCATPVRATCSCAPTGIGSTTSCASCWPGGGSSPARRPDRPASVPQWREAPDELPGPGLPAPARACHRAAGGVRRAPAAPQGVRGAVQQRRTAGNGRPSSPRLASAPDLRAAADRADGAERRRGPPRRGGARRPRPGDRHGRDRRVAVDAGHRRLPTRIAAAKSAATEFVSLLPARINVGLVAFGGNASVLVPPTLDRDSVRAGINNLQLQESTAIGEAVFTSLDAIKVFGQASTARGDKPPPARIVLMSDGANNKGRSIAQAIDAAKAAAVPVSTIAFGTETGSVTYQGETIPVPPDLQALQTLASGTHGSFHTAHSAQELKTVFSDIGSQIGYTTVHRDISWRFLAIGLLFTMAAAGTAMLWGGRLTDADQACGSSTNLPTELRSSSARCASAARSSG